MNVQFVLIVLGRSVIASRVAKLLKTFYGIRKYQKSLKFGWRHILVFSFPSRN